jgi:hypothetical protein
LFADTLEQSRNANYQRAIMFGLYYLAQIAFNKGVTEGTLDHLINLEQLAEYLGSKLDVAQSRHLRARIAFQQGDLSVSHINLTEAIDLFERLGMRRELAEAREELARLEAQMAEAAE